MAAETTLRERDAVVAVRPPFGPEKQACRMLLPEACERRMRWSFLVALTEAPLRILGALAHMPVRHHGRLARRMVLRVAKPYRRQGIGSQLLQALIHATRARGIGTVLAWHDPRQEPGAAGFLRAHGFVLQDRLTTFETDLDALVDLLRPLRYLRNAIFHLTFANDYS
ncbi:MAG: GNAT family N-acetyltransferase, partial [Gemmataceae bacterium]|nr:GNAT family N-acetyltransferase [Gemmataceae bacterium]